MIDSLVGMCALASAGIAQLALGEGKASEVSIAHDGRLAFVSGSGKTADIAIRDSHGRVGKLTGGGFKDTPAWSPDMKTIAFVWERDGNADIHLVDVQTGATSVLVGGPAQELHPNWSPDGSRLMFTRYTAGRPDDEALTLHTIDANGSTDRPMLTASYGSWSPDGRQVAHWRFFEGNADIAITDLVDGRERRLTSDPAFEGWPSWSPTGRWILFSGETGRTARISLLDPASGRKCPLTNGKFRDTSPRWSPDGNTIYFDRASGSNVRIMAIDIRMRRK